MKKFTAKTLTIFLFATIFLFNQTSVKADQISTDYFEKVELNEVLPDTFYKNEVYLIQGTIRSKNYDTTSVILEQTESGESTTFTSPVTNGKFSIPVFFSKPGEYYIGIIPGEDGDSKAATINVAENLPLSINTATAPAINSLKMNYLNDQTVVEINPAFPSIKKFTFVQKAQKVTYLSRQNTSSIPINYTDFKAFTPGKILFYAEQAKISDSTKDLSILSPYSKSETKFFTGIEHTFSEIRNKDIVADPPDKLDKLSTISFSGKVNTDTDLRAYVIKPDGFIDTLTLKTKPSKKSSYKSKSIIKSGGDYTFTYSPKTTGRYILEISNKEGLPILNHPTYIGNEIPIIPDFFDLNTRKISKTKPFVLEVLRKELLNEINKSRLAHGLKKVELDPAINALAQAHSEDMSKNNYFSHHNLSGQSPEDRRIAAGLQMPVSENIAKDVAIKFAHEGLMRSASHRSNILEKDWTKVGIGISKKNGYFYISQEFSASPLSKTDIENLREDLFSQINATRKAKKVSELTYSPSLETVAKALNTDSIESDSPLTNKALSQVVDEFEISGSTLAVGRTYMSWDPILKSIIESEEKIIESKWKTIGIDIQIDPSGNINAMLIINRA